MLGFPSAEIAQIEYWPVDIPITDPFVVATGSHVVAEKVSVRITLSDGTCGYGEAAPNPEVGGEARETCLNALPSPALLLIGRPALGRAGARSHAHTVPCVY